MESFREATITQRSEKNYLGILNFRTFFLEKRRQNGEISDGLTLCIHFESFLKFFLPEGAFPIESAGLLWYNMIGILLVMKIRDTARRER